MMKAKIRIAACICLALLLAGWIALFLSFRDSAFELFPNSIFEIYPLTDAVSGGFSTSEISVKENSISADVNIRSGMAYPYAGVGFNLMSVNGRPAASFYNFSKFDSVEIEASASRMKSLSLRILTNDPVYSEQGNYLSYRHLTLQVPVSSSTGKMKVALSDFKVPEWWLAGHGLDNDDGFTYWNRGVFFEISNGEGVLRGIPDEFEVKYVKFYGINHGFENAMYVALAFLILIFLMMFVVSKKNSGNRKPKRVVVNSKKK